MSTTIRRPLRLTIVILGVAIACTRPAAGWWDTQVRAQQPEPLVKEMPAAGLAGAKTMADDPQADGGKGGKAAFVAPGEELLFELELPPSCYSVWLVARAEEKEYKKPEGAVKLELPSGDPATPVRELEVPLPRLPVFVTLGLQEPDGRKHEWRMPAIFRTSYGVVSKMYFPLHLTGKCSFKVGLGKDSASGLLFDRIEVRDVLGNCARVAAKDKPMLSKRHAGAGQAAALTAARRAKNDELWAAIPELNLMEGTPGWNKWHAAIGRDRKGNILQLAEKFEESGTEETGWDAAVLLCALAEKYPCLDFYFSETSASSMLRRADAPTWSSRLGKSVYSGWAGPDLMRVVQAYDKVFDFIAHNQALADYVHTRIPWVETPQDVIKLLDTNLLQHGIDCLNRRIIRSDELAAFLPLVQGVNEVSRRMLADGLFRAIHMNMADAGGIDDQAFTSFSRCGVHYTGSTGYVGPVLEEIANHLKIYRAAGGDPKFDMSDPERYPHMALAAYTKNALHAAGGFPIQIGDAGDLRRGRAKDIPAYPSRVLEGFGAAIIEDGQDLANPLAKRAVAVRTGIGRGHAHQDSLNLEMFAHGVRLLPDLGGRHEGKNHARPNMRTNRMHNMVWVDRREFVNEFPGSTTSGFGWTTAFSPQPGAQYMANAARATSHPQVSLYQRTTAMIDGAATPDSADVYLFDVFRVQGGKEHVYCFHGAYAETMTANLELKPAQSAEAGVILDKRPEASRQEGVAGATLVATWPLQEAMQKSHQDKSYQADRPVAMTLSLFDRADERVFVGSAESAVYPVDMPYLHVQRQQEQDGLASVYPAIMEAHAGGRFIAEARKLELAPAPLPGEATGGVALAVNLTNGRRDFCFSSLKPEVEYKTADGATVTGEFAFVAKDQAGVVAAHLVGGTQLVHGDFSISCVQPAYAAKITAVDYARQTLTLSEALPAKILDGQMAMIGNNLRQDSFQMQTVAGTQAKAARTPRFYQSALVAVDAAQGTVETELEPAVYGCDTQYCLGTTVANEAHDKFWQANAEPRERWMYLGWPGTRLSYPREMLLTDLPDTNGDGRRTVRMLGSGDKNEPADKVLLELEVTRVDPANNLFYFKMPAAPKTEADTDYRQGGWQFANRILENEDGSKRWLATYPGTAFLWNLNGAPVQDADFADADKDGKRKLFAYLYGPGDTFTIKTFVHVRRVGENYEIRANAPCTIQLPGRPAIKLTPEQLAAGVYAIERGREPRQAETGIATP